MQHDVTQTPCATRWLVGTLCLLTLAAVLAVALGGCVSVDNGPSGPKMCEVSSDCDSGEVCDEGICWGNPPNLVLAAEIVPPESRPELARTEIPLLRISSDGNVENAQFAPSVLVEGRVVLAVDPQRSVAARIVFRRPSRIPGAPDYRVSVTSEPGRTSGEVSFRARLTPNDPKNPEDQYEVSIFPDDGAISPNTGGDPTPAELVPPRRSRFAITTDLRDVTFSLGDIEGLKQITGRVTDAVGGGVPGMVVRAFGRFQPELPLELASSVGRTGPDGKFLVLVPRSWEDTFELVISPAPGNVKPTITRRNVVVEDPDGPWTVTKDIGAIALPAHPAPVPWVLPVQGTGSAGNTEKATGAEATFRTLLLSDTNQDVWFEQTAIADADGKVRVQLIPADQNGNRHYSVDVVTPAGSTLAGLWGASVEVGLAPQGEGTLEPLSLPARVYVTGTLAQEAGVAAEDVTVRARPSLTYLWAENMTAELRAEAKTLGFPETSTDLMGNFGIYLDPEVLGLPTSYDLDWIPPAGSLLPRWGITGVDLSGYDPARRATELGVQVLPHASYARGEILDEAGLPVPDAEIRLYVVPTEASDVCVQRVDEGCQDPARLAAHTRSDLDGRLVLVLPAP